MKENEVISAERIRQVAAELNEQMLDFCARLIRVPSLPGEEGAVANIVQDEMVSLGYDEVFRDDWGNVVGLVHGTEDGPSIMYNGHMDVVTEGAVSEWTGYDPYGAAIDEALVLNRDGSLEELTEVMHGRGASDMKCGLGAQIYTGAALVRLKREGVSWKGSFILAAVVLEENAEMMGTIKLTEETFSKRGIRVDAMVSAEPSSLDLKLGHRGRLELKITVYGKSCHGSSPWLGVNAVEKAAPLITAIRTLFDAKTTEDIHLGRPGITLTIIDCEPAALCIVPDRCHLTYDCRLIPGETVTGAIAEIQALIDDMHAKDPCFNAGIAINSSVRHAYTGLYEEIESQKEVWIIDREHPFIRACAAGLTEVGQEVRYGYWAFSTDIPQLGSVMKKPCVGYSGGQEYYIHNGTEKIRLDYLKMSLEGNIAIFLKASELPLDSFHV
ncbi:MAG: M20/M25/M40 family metallo-hydrolase [Clostridiales Family XIII bacterium]|nr:M20/M25/M40 family metallo-hydrolase [Clostridiales Family XIII bacterium]